MLLYLAVLLFHQAVPVIRRRSRRRRTGEAGNPRRSLRTQPDKTMGIARHWHKTSTTWHPREPLSVRYGLAGIEESVYSSITQSQSLRRMPPDGESSSGLFLCSGIAADRESLPQYQLRSQFVEAAKGSRLVGVEPCMTCLAKRNLLSVAPDDHDIGWLSTVSTPSAGHSPSPLAGCPPGPVPRRRH